jgi:Tetratricopeptide repeat
MAEPPRKPSRTPQPDDLAGSDFLFHLYRGAELLQENQVHEAKSELENALRLQPREPQGQDLLAQVYFRLGLYPRSIAIYETLAESFPDEVTPRVNLALCYLKTGQPERARDQLEHVVSTEPARQRAWGYLGLAFERLGDYGKARAAFDRAGHSSMVRRMDSLLEQRHAPSAPSLSEPEPGPDLTELRSVAEAAFHELNAADCAFSLALPSEHTSYESGSWFEVQMGQSSVKAPRRPRSTTPVPPVALPDRIPEPPQPHLPTAREVASSVPAAKPVELFARESSLVFPRDGRATRHSGGSVLVSLIGEFAVRLDLAQAITTAGRLAANTVLPRHGSDGGQFHPLGGSTRPLTIVEGAHQLVLRARPAQSIHIVELNDQSMYVREDCLGGFDSALEYDNGRLASGHGDTIALVHVHGTGLVVLELPRSFAAVETSEAAGCVLRCASMLGWVGRVVARCLPVADAPGDSRGWAAFSGDGSVLFDPACESDF